MPAMDLDSALLRCRQLYASSRSGEALPIARAALAEATARGDRLLMRRAETACGLLSADTADLVAAVEHHVHALHMAMEEDDVVEMSRVWVNIGGATNIAGNYEMGARCYRRALALVDGIEGPLYSRFAASGNLADCCYFLGDIAEGVRCGERALRELTPDFRLQEPYAALLLRRNMVRLFVAAGRMEEARSHVDAVVSLAEGLASERARIAADLARSTYEVAVGQFDIALTRLDQALAQAREVPATLHDVLACLVKAEEAAGHPARALMRLEELSGHVYRLGIRRAREHVEIAALIDESATLDPAEEQAKARLISQLHPPAQPETWKALQRLGVSAVMRMDGTGWHGMRVGALVKALAVAIGLPPLQALEMGLAAELHDIGMVSVPPAILSKRGPLNEAERAIVRRHADAGAEVLADESHPRMLLAREIARYHHAHWDGKGYPERVGGEFIPLGARLCAVADAYDMMVCGFGGREARPLGHALDELRAHAGTQFDPQLVEAFERMVRDESEGLGVDLSSSAGMEDFQELVASLNGERGFV